jgi:hypothetical protein
VLVDHRRKEGMGDQEDVVEVDPIELIPQLRLRFYESARMPQPVAHIVHEDIGPAVAIQHRCREPGDLVGFADVRDDRQRRSTAGSDRCDGLLGEFGVDVGDDHLGAMLREQPRGRRPDPATAAGHHRDPAGEQG